MNERENGITLIWDPGEGGGGVAWLQIYPVSTLF